MGAPLISRVRVLAAKVETSPGTAESLTAAEAAYRVYNLREAPNIAFEERAAIGPGLSPQAGVLGARAGTITFEMDLFGGASAPASLTTFLTACGLKLTTATYSPESRPPEAASSGAETITLGCYINGIKKLLYGAMGNAVFRFRPGQVARVAYTFTGIWGDPTDVAILAPSPPTTAPLRFVSAALAVAKASGSASPKVGELTLDLGNTVVLREDGSAASGYHSAVVSNRRTILTMDPEAALVADWDVHGEWTSLAERQISWAMGTAGNKLTFTVPKAQIVNVVPGERNGLDINTITYQANANDLTEAGGDDEFSILSE